MLSHAIYMIVLLELFIIIKELVPYLGGHVKIGDYAILGGNSSVHQFVTIGKHSMISRCLS